MNRLLSLVLVLTLFATSCTKLREVDIKKVDIKSFQLLNTSTANIELEYLIQNPSGRRLIIESASALLKRSGVDFATATMIKADTIPPRTQSLYRASFRIEVSDPLALLSMGLNLSKWSYKDFRVDARATIKASGRGKKTIKFKDIPLENLINRL